MTTLHIEFEGYTRRRIYVGHYQRVVDSSNDVITGTSLTPYTLNGSTREVTIPDLAPGHIEVVDPAGVSRVYLLPDSAEIVELADLTEIDRDTLDPEAAPGPGWATELAATNARIDTLVDEGVPGNPGLSAYQVALANGFSGSQSAWLTSLHGTSSTEPGPPGPSAYEVAVGNGFEGTEPEWLASLHGAEKGDPGDPGASAYQIAVAGGYTGSQSAWLVSLKGTNGLNGKSAYQIALDNGFVGTESAWLLSLKGVKGDASTVAGKSAYQVALDNGFVGTQSAWLASLHGADSTVQGPAGLSAYQQAVALGYNGTSQQWLDSLKSTQVTQDSVDPDILVYTIGS